MGESGDELLLDLEIKAEGLGNLVKTQEIIGQTVKEVLAREVTSLLKDLRETLPAASGRLRDSLQISLSQEDNTFRAKIRTDLPYALAVEKGTRPHRPPLAPLISWARGTPGLAGSEKDGRRIAFLVARKIARVGTKGRHTFAEAEEKGRERLAREVEKGANVIDRELSDK